MSGYGDALFPTPVLYVSPGRSDLRRILGPHPGDPRQVVVGVDVLLKFLDGVGVSRWNRWMEKLYQKNWLCSVWSEGQKPPLFSVDVDLSDVDLSGMKLNGIDLRFACLQNTSLQGASLCGARFNVSDISGTIFAGAVFDGADFEGAVYTKGNPPIGLSAHVMQQCSVDDDE